MAYVIRGGGKGQGQLAKEVMTVDDQVNPGLQHQLEGRRALLPPPLSFSKLHNLQSLKCLIKTDADSGIMARPHPY